MPSCGYSASISWALMASIVTHEPKNVIDELANEPYKVTKRIARTKVLPEVGCFEKAICEVIVIFNNGG